MPTPIKVKKWPLRRGFKFCNAIAALLSPMLSQAERENVDEVEINIGSLATSLFGEENAALIAEMLFFGSDVFGDKPYSDDLADEIEFETAIKALEEVLKHNLVFLKDVIQRANSFKERFTSQG